MSTTSTYMGFPISTIGTDSGLNWETNLNAALSVIDQHNHSPGQGQQIQPNGININSDLSFGSNNATNLRTTRFSPQITPISNTGSDVGELYVAGNELYYNDVSGGNQVQITSNGNVNATSSGISSGTASASFSVGVLNVKSSSTSFGSVAMLSAVLSNNGNLVNQLTLQAPVLSGSIIETLPTVPASTGFMTMDPSGNMAASIATSGGITAGNIAAGTITTTQIASNTIVNGNIADATITSAKISNSANINPLQLDSISTGDWFIESSASGSFSTSSTSFVQVTNLSIKLAAYSSTRPVYISFKGGTIGLAGTSTTLISGTFRLQLSNLTTTQTLADFPFSFAFGSQQTMTVLLPASALNYIAINPVSFSFKPFVQLFAKVTNGSITVTDVTMQVLQV